MFAGCFSSEARSLGCRCFLLGLVQVRTESKNFLKLRIPNHIAMIQRNLCRASRHIAPRISQRTLITPPRQSPAFIRLPALQPPSSRLASRWYSDAAETKTTPKENGEAGGASKSSEKSPSPSEVHTLKAELESKNKEIIDLKVAPSPGHNSTLLTITRTSTSVPSQTIATYKTAQNAKCNPREILPSRTSQRTSSPASTTSSTPSSPFPPSASPRLPLHRRTPRPPTSYQRYTRTLFRFIKDCS